MFIEDHPVDGKKKKRNLYLYLYFLKNRDNGKDPDLK